MGFVQVNFDGLVGPTHHYGGLSYGNIPSMSHRDTRSNPKQAALQGLRKMETVAEYDVHQAVLPPAPRPDLRAAKRLGYSGSPEEVLSTLGRDDPSLLSALSSASSMWAANAAVTAPAPDTESSQTHITPANLVSTFHRSLEATWTESFFQHLFDHPDVTVHERLPPNSEYRDEGAANHMRFSPGRDEPGLQVFVHGTETKQEQSTGFPARQSAAASRALARLHRIPDNRKFHVKQNSRVLEAGGFHNDLVAVGHRNVLFYHQQAYDSSSFAMKLKDRYQELYGDEFYCLDVSSNHLDLDEAIESYLFNSQIVSTDQGKMTLIAAEHVKNYSSARSVLESVVSGNNPIDDVRFVKLRQSMKNGGGPACLRLKTLLPESVLSDLAGSYLLDQTLLEELKRCVKELYPDSLKIEDLENPDFYRSCKQIYHRLGKIFGIEQLYSKTLI
ncbi:MAG: N-succinylarginine dihydrolase [bacterium]